MSLTDDNEYFNSNKLYFIETYLGKYIVIKDRKVLGAFSTEEEAIENALKSHKIGTFLVKLVSKEEDVRHFFSRVSFG